MRAAFRDPARRLLLVAGFLAFVAIGAIQAMYGPAFPGLVDRFGVGLEVVGATVVLHFGGSFVTIAAASVLLTRFGYRPVLFAGGLSMFAGSTMVGVAPVWSWVLAGALLNGIGFGLLNVSFNLVVARVFAPHAAPALNLLSAVFGAGAMLGPLLIGLAGPAVQRPFLVVAALTAVTTLFTLRLPEPEPPPAAGRERVPWVAAGGFVVMYFLYVSGEAGIASWETVHLEPSLGADRAAYMTSVYWGAITVGRLLGTPLSARVGSATLVLASVAVGFAALLAAHVTPFAPVAYTAAGLAFAPVFPTGLAWIQRVFPRRSERVVPIVFAVANLGPVATTGVIGASVAWGGPGVVPTALSGIVALLLATTAWLWWSTRRA